MALINLNRLMAFTDENELNAINQLKLIKWH